MRILIKKIWNWLFVCPKCKTCACWSQNEEDSGGTCNVYLDRNFYREPEADACHHYKQTPLTTKYRVN